MTPDQLPSPARRSFLTTLGVGGAAALAWPGATTACASDDAAPGKSAMPADLLQIAQPPKANMGSLFPSIEAFAGDGPYPDSFLGERHATLDAFKTAGRARVWEAFGKQPARVPPRAEVIDRQDFDDFTREKVLFSTTPAFRVPAYVFIPRKRKQPAPAIVDLHSHGGMFLFGKEKVIDFGENHPVMTTYHERNYGGRPTATALARRGYVVITIDAFMFGERRLLLEEDARYGWERANYSLADADHLNRKCRGKESTVAKSLSLAGTSWPGVVTWDDVRTVDYLAARPEVDPRRIGCLGVSLGGWRTIFLAGLDERIAAACIVGFMSTVRPMLARHIDTHSFVHFVPGLHQHLDLPDVASLMAPKPLLVQQCRQDGLFPLSGMEASVEKIAAVYAKAGAARRFDGRFYDVPHRFDVPMQDEAFAWLDEQLHP
jgi:dienelactone hydrolase